MKSNLLVYRTDPLVGALYHADTLQTLGIPVGSVVMCLGQDRTKGLADIFYILYADKKLSVWGGHLQNRVIP